MLFISNGERRINVAYIKEWWIDYSLDKNIFVVEIIDNEESLKKLVVNVTPIIDDLIKNIDEKDLDRVVMDIKYKTIKDFKDMNLEKSVKTFKEGDEVIKEIDLSELVYINAIQIIENYKGNKRG